MKQVDLTGCDAQFAVVDIKTGESVAFNNFDIAEMVADAKAIGSPQVIIDMETMQVIDVFADGGRLLIGACGVRILGEEVRDVE